MNQSSSHAIKVQQDFIRKRDSIDSFTSNKEEEEENGYQDKNISDQNGDELLSDNQFSIDEEDQNDNHNVEIQYHKFQENQEHNKLNKSREFKHKISPRESQGSDKEQNQTNQEDFQKQHYEDVDEDPKNIRNKGNEMQKEQKLISVTSALSSADKQNFDKKQANKIEAIMTMSMIDNFLMHSAVQNESSLKISERICSVSDYDLRKQLIRYDTDDMTANTFLNPHELSYSSLSQIHPSVSQYYADQNSIPKEDVFASGSNLLSGLKSNISGRVDKNDIQEVLPFDKASKYYNKFLKGENLNESSVVNNTSANLDLSNLIPNRSHTRSLITDAHLPPKGSIDTTSQSLRFSKLDSAQRQKYMLHQNKILMEGYVKLQKEVEILSHQITNQKSKYYKKSQAEDVAHSKHKKQDDFLKTFLQDISQKQAGEIEGLKAELFELKQWKIEKEELVKNQSQKMKELENGIEKKDSLLNEKDEEIKNLLIENDRIKSDNIQQFYIQQKQCMRSTAPGSKSHFDNISSPQVDQSNLFKRNSFHSEKQAPKLRERPQQQGSLNNTFQKSNIELSEVTAAKENKDLTDSRQINNFQRRDLNSNSEAQRKDNKNEQIREYKSSQQKNKSTENSTSRSQQKISIEKIASEIQQLKNSLIHTEKLLKTARSSNQTLTGQIQQAEKIKNDLSQRNSTATLNNHEEFFFPNSAIMGDNNPPFRTKINYFDQEKNKSMNVQNETSQSDIQIVSNIFTPRDISHHLVSPQLSRTQLKSNVQQSETVLNDQNYQNQNIIPNNNNNHDDGKQELNRQEREYMNLNIQQQISQDVQCNNIEQSEQQNKANAQKQINFNPNNNNSDLNQEFNHQLSVMGGQMSDEISSNSHSMINNNNNNNHFYNNNNNNRKQRDGQQENIQQQIINSKHSPMQDQYIQQKQQEETIFKRIEEQRHKNGSENKQIIANLNLQQQLSSDQNLTQYGRQIPYFQQQHSDLQLIPLLQQQYQFPLRNKYSDEMFYNSPNQQREPYQDLQQQQYQQQLQFIQQHQNQEQISRNSQPQPIDINNRAQFGWNQSQEQFHQSNHLNIPKSNYQSPIHDRLSIQNKTNFSRGILSTTSSPKISQNLPYSSKGPLRSLNPEYSTSSLVLIQPSTSMQFGNYLNSSQGSNLGRFGGNSSVMNTVQSEKGESLKKLNQQLVKLELEKNQIETKLLQEEHTMGKRISLELNQHLKAVCNQIKQVRVYMMEQAV